MGKDLKEALERSAEEMSKDDKDIEPYNLSLTITGKDATMVRTLIAVCNEGQEQNMLLTVFRLGLMSSVKRLGTKIFGMGFPRTE